MFRVHGSMGFAREAPVVLAHAVLPWPLYLPREHQSGGAKMMREGNYCGFPSGQEDRRQADEQWHERQNSGNETVDSM